MANVIAHLRIHETKRPIAGLLVTWYSTTASVIPESVHRATGWEAMRATNWPGLDVIRLGAAASDERGIARLQYETANIDVRRVANLWYTVQLPELAGVSDCGRIVHVACNVIQSPGETEVHIVDFPQQVVGKLGIDKRVAPVIDSERTSSDFDVQLQKAERPGGDSTISPGNLFSLKFNQRIDDAKSVREREIGRAFDPMSFALNVDLQSSRSEKRPMLKFDKNKRKLTVRRDDGGGDRPLVYNGILRYTNAGLTDGKLRKPHALINEETGRFKLALPKVPDSLELPETASPLLARRNSEETAP